MLCEARPNDRKGKKGGTQDLSKESAPASSPQSGRREEATIKFFDLGPRRSEKPSAPIQTPSKGEWEGEGCKTDPEPDMDNGRARVRNMRSKCRCSYVLQFTFRRAVCCVLHRPPSQVIHCAVLSLFDSSRLPRQQSPGQLFFSENPTPLLRREGDWVASSFLHGEGEQRFCERNQTGGERPLSRSHVRTSDSFPPGKRRGRPLRFPEPRPTPSLGQRQTGRRPTDREPTPPEREAGTPTKPDADFQTFGQVRSEETR